MITQYYEDVIKLCEENNIQYSFELEDAVNLSAYNKDYILKTANITAEFQKQDKTLRLSFPEHDIIKQSLMTSLINGFFLI